MTSVFNKPRTTDAPLNPFLQPILDFLADPQNNKIPTDIIATVTTSSNTAHSLGQLWDAFFTTVLCTDPLPLNYSPHVAFLNALSAHPPTKPRNHEALLRQGYTLPDNKLQWAPEPLRFHNSRRDTHDGLEAWRHLKGTVRSAEALIAAAALSDDSGGSSDDDSASLPSHAQCYLRICAFSAALLKESEKGGIKSDPMQVFFASVRMLEFERPASRQEKADPLHCISTDEVWAFDVHVAAIWIRDGAQILLNADQQELRKEWVALDEPTELWSEGKGMTRARWEFWGARLRHLSADGESLDAETRAAVVEAAEVVERLLNGNPTV